MIAALWLVMADTYRAWLRSERKWQEIDVIDLPTIDGTGKRLQTAGLKTLGQIDAMPGTELLKLPGLGVGVVKRVRTLIRTYKGVERRRRPATALKRLPRSLSVLTLPGEKPTHE